MQAIGFTEYHTYEEHRERDFATQFGSINDYNVTDIVGSQVRAN